MDGSREYDLFVRQQPKQARMCGVGGMSLYLFFFVLLDFILFRWIYMNYISFRFTAIHWGVPAHSLNEKKKSPSRSSTNRPSAHRAATRHRQSSKEPSFALSFPPATTSPATALPPPWTHPRVFRALGYFNAHSSRLRYRPVPSESVLFHVCEPCQARRRHGAALDEGAFVCL